jgi:hypothetical protein
MAASRDKNSVPKGGWSQLIEEVPTAALGISIAAVILAVVAVVFADNEVLGGVAVLVAAVAVLLCGSILYGLIKKLLALMPPAPKK